MNKILKNLYLNDDTHVPVYHYERTCDIVTYRFAFRVGPNNEQLNTLGITHFLEHIIAQKMKRISIQNTTLDSFILDRGGRCNAMTYTEYMVVTVTMAGKEDALLVFPALCKIFDELVLDTEIVENERSAIKSEIRRKARTIDERMYWKVNETFYGGTGYAYYRLGTLETLENITEENLLEFYKEHLNNSNKIIVIAGDISEKECLNLCSEQKQLLLKDASSSFSNNSSEIRFNLSPDRIQTEEYPTNEIHTLLAWPTISSTNTDSIILYVISQMFAADSDSILYRKLRYENGYVYSVLAFSVTYMNAGHFMINTSCSKDVIGKVISIIKDSLKDLIENPISKEDLHLIYLRIKGKNTLREESLDRFVDRDVHALLYPPSFLQEQYLSVIANLKPEDIQRVTKTYLSTDSMYTFLFGTKEMLDNISSSID